MVVMIVGMKIKIVIAVWALFCAMCGSILWTFELQLFLHTGYLDWIMVIGLLLLFVPSGGFAGLDKFNIFEVDES